MLAARSNKWALVRSLTHPYNEHSNGHMVMLSGRTPMPPGFDPGKPKPTDWPSIAAIAGDLLAPANNLPPAIMLPERLVHRTLRVIPGQFAGVMGNHRDPWIVSASPFRAETYGAYPEYEFHHERGKENTKVPFQAPNLALPQGLSQQDFTNRLGLRRMLDQQRGDLERAAERRAVRSRPPERHFAPVRSQHPGRVRCLAGRRENSGAVRQELVRLVAA